MSTRFSFKLPQLIIAIVIIILFTATFTLTVFWLGQQNALRIRPVEGESVSDSTSLQPSQSVLPESTLPRAMTATPKAVTAQQIILTEQQATQLVLEKSQEKLSESVFELSGITITQDVLVIKGVLDYMGYKGQVEVVGIPVVEFARLHFDLDSVEVDGQGLPQMFYSTIETEINALFEEALFGYDVETVQLDNGIMIISVLPW